MLVRLGESQGDIVGAGIGRGVRGGKRNHIPAVVSLAQSSSAVSVALSRTCHELEGHGNAILIVRHVCGVFWVVWWAVEWCFAVAEVVLSTHHQVRNRGRSLAEEAGPVTSSPTTAALRQQSRLFTTSDDTTSLSLSLSTPPDSLRHRYHAVHTIRSSQHAAPDSRLPIAPLAAAASPWLQNNPKENGSTGKEDSMDMDNAHLLTIVQKEEQSGIVYGELHTPSTGH